MYQVEVKWNRSFEFVSYGNPIDSLDNAIKYGKALEDMGDGASVKGFRIVDQDQKVVYAYGKRVSQEPTNHANI